MPSKKRGNVRPMVLVICDGLGSAPAGLQGNAVLMAKTPALMGLWERYPHTELFAHGQHVGLPKHQPGNSEAGHLNLGAGRVVYQDLTLIHRAIEEGSFFSNPVLRGAMEAVKKSALPYL